MYADAAAAAAATAGGAAGAAGAAVVAQGALPAADSPRGVPAALTALLSMGV